MITQTPAEVTRPAETDRQSLQGWRAPARPGPRVQKSQVSKFQDQESGTKGQEKPNTTESHEPTAEI